MHFADLVSTTLELCALHHISLAELIDQGLADSKPEPKPEPKKELPIAA